MAAQSEIYELYADVLFGICLKYSRNYQDAEDTLQDSFLIIFDKITSDTNNFRRAGNVQVKPRDVSVVDREVAATTLGPKRRRG